VGALWTIEHVIGVLHHYGDSWEIYPRSDADFGAYAEGETPFLHGAWINEMHYEDDQSPDLNEGVEIAGPAGEDLAGWSIVLYNGNGGVTYDTVSLSGVFPDEELSGYGAIWFAAEGMQNGSPDGLALVNPDGDVEQFLSYEGVVTATNGPASGTSSTNIGVQESSSPLQTQSLQISGCGPGGTSTFAWQAPAASTHDTKNNGQTFSDTCGSR